MRHIIYIVIATTLLFFGCSSKKATTDDGSLYIVTTTGMIEDALKNIIGDKGTVEALMGPGVDPHLYKAAQSDLKKMSDADMIFYNGLHLEGKMADILGNYSRQKPVFAVADGIESRKLLKSTTYATPDPHVWFDVAIWKQAVHYAGEQVAKTDTANAAYYLKNTEAYIQQLDSLDLWVKQQITLIPQKQRVLVTAHDAFGYFGKAYNIEVRGLQGISTVAQAGLKDAKELTDMIIERGIKAIFVETSISERSIKQIVESANEQHHKVVIGGSLYSDAMGEAGTPEGTYIGMVKHNVNTIVKALK